MHQLPVMTRFSCLFLAAAMTLFHTDEAVATLQTPEVLLLNGIQEDLLCYPLGSWVGTHPGALPESDVQSTARWRGYVGTWEIVDDRLWLRKIEVTYVDGEDNTELVPLDLDPDGHWREGKSYATKIPRFVEHDVLRQVFPEGDPVSADWFSGSLIVRLSASSEGDPVKSRSVAARYISISVQSGLVVQEREFDEAALREYRKASFERVKTTELYKKQFAEGVAEFGPQLAEQLILDRAANECFPLNIE